MTLTTTNLLGAQATWAPELGHAFYPVTPASMATAREVGERWWAARAATVSSFMLDPGLVNANELLIWDYELWVVGAAAGVPLAAGAVGGSARAGDRAIPWHTSATAEVGARGVWSGVLDPIIDLHHSVTGLPDAGRPNRPRGEVLIAVAPATPVDPDTYEELIPDAAISRTSPALSPYARTELALSLGRRAPATAYAGATAFTLPPPRDGARPVPGATAGAGLRVATERDRRVALAAEAGAWYPWIAPSAWDVVLARRAMWHTRVDVTVRIGRGELVAGFRAARSPFGYDHPRLLPATPTQFSLVPFATSTSVAWRMPLDRAAPGARPLQVELGFIQELISFITPDFGILGEVRGTWQ